MEKKDKPLTIGVLTSGGDAPGMNACIRAVVRVGIARGCKMVGIKRGYAGLLAEEFIDMDVTTVCETIQKGGTILQTARCPEFLTEEGQEHGARICKKHGLDALIVIGGDGSFRGAQQLSRRGINVVGIPGTIDLDIPCTEYSIGFDTAINTAMSAIDKIRDTSSSHERCSIIEVMGRNAGYIALYCGIANGAEDILLPEFYDGNEQAIINNIISNRKRGKTHHIIVNAEGIGHSNQLAKTIEAATGIETRATILGYLQRGGNPTCTDRVHASTMGALAVDVLVAGKKNKIIAYRSGQYVDLDIEEALKMKKDISEYQYEVSRMLSL
ncbi:MAG: 6-phosphofructokinase [Lachnospiraceae bacterium]|nr:6-phosphofructokinase [Lachnospiraceae bacterium]